MFSAGKKTNADAICMKMYVLDVRRQVGEEVVGGYFIYISSWGLIYKKLKPNAPERDEDVTC